MVARGVSSARRGRRPDLDWNDKVSESSGRWWHAILHGLRRDVPTVSDEEPFSQIAGNVSTVPRRTGPVFVGAVRGDAVRHPAWPPCHPPTHLTASADTPSRP